MKQRNGFTLQLLGLVGSPFVKQNAEFGSQNAIGLYKFATKNRMSLLCLEALRRLDRVSGLQEEYDKLKGRYIETQRVTYRLSA